jgi:hypothetical protein
VPSPSFAVISEGSTDYEVIHTILAGYFADEAIVVRQLQPNPATPQHGNWAEVLKYCSSERFAGAFHDNDFVIVQIDTDVCERAPFNVPRSQPDGHPHSVDMMIEVVRARLIELIGLALYEQRRHQILFAICVDAIECWLLPLHLSDEHRGASSGCLEALKACLLARHGRPLSKKHGHYRRLALGYADNTTLHTHAHANPSLARFLADLRATFPTADPLNTSPQTPPPTRSPPH